MNRALIGYTGFVGSTLLDQSSFDQLYNSKNIEEIKGKQFDSVICAGAPAVKWKANQDPAGDLENLNRLMSNLENVKCDQFILISTVDVYAKPQNVNEDTLIIPEDISPYGRHRYYLEQFVVKNFPEHLIVRLPGLFGKGLKKNFIYDMIHNNCLHLHHKDSQFQFYDMSKLWGDIQTALKHDLTLVNFAPEPVTVTEIARECFGVTFDNVTEQQPALYDMKSKFSGLYNPGQNYMYNKDSVFNQLTDYIKSAMR